MADVSGTPALTDDEIVAAWNGATADRPAPGAIDLYLHYMRAVAKAQFAKCQASETTQIEALKRDAARWREHQEVMRNATIPDALHMRLTMNEGGKVWGVEYILDAAKFGRNTVLGIKAIGLAAEQKATALFKAMKEASDVAR